MKKLIFLFLALALSACSLAGGSELSRNHEKWQQAGVSNYRYTLHVGCFCAFMDRMPLTVEVRNGEPASMTWADGSPVDATDPNYQTFVQYATMDGLFAAVESEQKEADEVRISYDPHYGFPAEVYIDRIQQAMDDELSLQVSNFEILP